MTRISIFLIIVALVAGMAGCFTPFRLQYQLKLSSTEGGEVTTPGEGTFTYWGGTVVNLVAEAETGYCFVNWTGDVCACNIANVNATATNITINNDYTIIANFEETQAVQYQLAINSTEGGNVTTPGVGVFSYDEGTVVNLVAEADEGYQFVEWMGNVSTIANVNAAATNITMNSSYNITANFFYSILLAANLEAEQVIVASLEWYADFGVWPRHTADTSGNLSFYSYIDVTLKASYHFDNNGFLDGVGDPGTIPVMGGMTSSGWPDIHWENPVTIGHGQWVVDY
jgi:hypothetical protein